MPRLKGKKISFLSIDEKKKKKKKKKDALSMSPSLSSRTSSNRSTSALVLELTDRSTTECLRRLYVAEPPSTPDYIVFDQVNKTSVLALSRDKYFAFLSIQNRVS